MSIYALVRVDNDWIGAPDEICAQSLRARSVIASWEEGHVTLRRGAHEALVFSCQTVERALEFAGDLEALAKRIRAQLEKVKS